MNKYQNQIQLQSQKYTNEIEAPSYQIARDIMNKYCVGELVEIRQVIHTDNIVIKDDGDYHKYAKVKIRKGVNLFQSFKIPKIRKTASDIESQVLTTFTLNGQKPDSVEIQLVK